MVLVLHRTKNNYFLNYNVPDHDDTFPSGRGEVVFLEEIMNCKRMTVHAMGIKSDQIEHTTNYHITECTEKEGNCGAIHAEDALLIKMPYPDMVIISHSPCVKCAKMLAGAGVKKVYYIHEYRIRDGIEYLESNGIEVIQL